MNKSAFIGGFMGAFAFFVLEEMYYRFIRNDEESFWESRQFEDSLEKADDLCEIGYTFQRNEIIYKKSLKKSGWLKY